MLMQDDILAIMSLMMVKLWLQRVKWRINLRRCQLHYLRCKAVVICLIAMPLCLSSSNNSALCLFLSPLTSSSYTPLFLAFSPTGQPASYSLSSLSHSFPSLSLPSITNEAGASIYSVSPEAVKEMPDMDPNLRSAGTLARQPGWFFFIWWWFRILPNSCVIFLAVVLWALVYVKITGVVKDTMYRAAPNEYFNYRLKGQFTPRSNTHISPLSCSALYHQGFFGVSCHVLQISAVKMSPFFSI